LHPSAPLRRPDSDSNGCKCGIATGTTGIAAVMCGTATIKSESRVVQLNAAAQQRPG
jgi:hypothetical protein